MAGWRPPETVCVKVIGLAWRRESLLAVEIDTDAGTLKGVRPPGGSVQFGESREEALRREFLEELASPVVIVGGWHVFENIYRHEGAPGHEIIFAVAVDLIRRELYDQEEILFAEDDGTRCRARWFEPSSLRRSRLELYPTSLAEYLDGQRCGMAGQGGTARHK
ncbi:hypothetical protein LMIY3S_01378 [Labrys miyagiensis]